MRASIITTVLDSHEIVRRQTLYLNGIMPDGVEWILVDDGSNPPITMPECRFPVTVHQTNNFSPWTEREARRIGVGLSSSDVLICVDIDHIVTGQLIEFVINAKHDFCKFRRRFGVLDEHGRLLKDRRTMLEYGLSKSRIAKHGLRMTPPGNCYAISKALFWAALKEEHWDRRLKHRVSRFARNGVASVCPTKLRPLVYSIPNGRHCGDVNTNPFGLFHGLPRDSAEYQESEKILI